MGTRELDDAASAAVRDLDSDLGIDGRVLDLCGASADHFDVPPDAPVVFDGAASAALPYGDAAFDDVLCSRGVGALTDPEVTFAEAARVLRPDGHFVCTFTSRPRADTAVGGWMASDDAGRVRIVRGYFGLAPGFGPPESDLRTSLTGSGDRLSAVWSARAPG
jgi:SAM-dependent methyltransferase